jgi:hypothetical protein
MPVIAMNCGTGHGAGVLDLTTLKWPFQQNDLNFSRANHPVPGNDGTLWGRYH